METIDALFHASDADQLGLVDYGVDNTTGEIWLWNDPFGLAHPGVSADRAPWANGGITNPSAEALAFIGDSDTAEAINRDLVSISIAGELEDPISDDCLEAVAALSAYFASYFAASIGEELEAYPHVPNKKYGFVWWHNDFSSDRLCPGPVVMDATSEIIARTGELLNSANSLA